jgi:hypothetical protein
MSLQRIKYEFMLNKHYGPKRSAEFLKMEGLA